MEVKPAVQRKFLADFAMTFQAVFDFAFKNLIPILHASP
jgi:hypothetical protein